MRARHSGATLPWSRAHATDGPLGLNNLHRWPLRLLDNGHPSIVTVPHENPRQESVKTSAETEPATQHCRHVGRLVLHNWQRRRSAGEPGLSATNCSLRKWSTRSFIKLRSWMRIHVQGACHTELSLRFAHGGQAALNPGSVGTTRCNSAIMTDRRATSCLWLRQGCC